MHVSLLLEIRLGADPFVTHPLLADERGESCVLGVLMKGALVGGEVEKEYRVAHFGFESMVQFWKGGETAFLHII